MRCPQCGNEAGSQAAFCSRCGARLLQPRPAAVREYALSRVLRSWWHFIREFTMAAAMVTGGLLLLVVVAGYAIYGALLIVGGLGLIGLSVFVHNRISWSLSSDRLIEKHDLFNQAQREMELADIRSIDVHRSVRQRLFGLGTVTIASAASAQFMILMSDIRNPNEIANTIRQARLKRLA